MVWTNSDNVLHTVTDPAGAFDGWLLPGEEFAFTFDTPGTHMYGCTVHPWASGVVVVDSGAAPEPEPTASSGLAEAAVEGVLDLFETYGNNEALKMVNAMAADPDPRIGVFVIDENTMRVVAHSAVPQYVGLHTAPILDKAFIPTQTHVGHHRHAQRRRRLAELPDGGPAGKRHLVRPRLVQKNTTGT